MPNRLDQSRLKNKKINSKKLCAEFTAEFMCWFSECVYLSEDGGELGIQFVHVSLDGFFFIIIRFLLFYSRICFCRRQVKIITFTELSDGKI